jgi:hypothetical protein
MEWIYNDGGRSEAGFKGDTGDCVCRAFAIATGKPYKTVYDDINRIAKNERTGTRKKGTSNARTGVHKYTEKKLAALYGFKWIPTMKIGEGCKVHLTAEELPKGTIIVAVARHLVCVKDGVIQDTYNSSIKQHYDTDGTLITNDRRCVYGYFVKA